MKNIKIHKVKTHSKEWYDWRRGAKIGCSEIRTILYSDDYSDAIILYYKKLGLKNDTWDNEAMLWGRENEDTIARMWQYWDGKTDEWQRKNYINNLAQGNIIRKCKRIGGIVSNEKYPYLFGNVDRIIQKKGGFNLLTGEQLQQEGILEIKTIENWVADKWEFGIDPAYLTQLTGYLMLMNLTYGEIAVLKNGRYLDVFPFEFNKNLAETIDISVTEFCEKHIIPALPYAENYKKALSINDKILEKDCLQAIHELEPPVSDKAAYEQFVKEKWTNKEISVPGNEKLLTFAVKDKRLAYMKGFIEKIKQENKNHLLNFIDHADASVIDFGNDGEVKFFVRKGSQLPQLGNNIKTDIGKTILESAILDLVG